MPTPLRFEVFTPADAPEQSAVPDYEARLRRAWEDGHAAGFVAGAEAAARENAERQDQLRARMVEVLKDAILDRNAAQAQILGRIWPTVAALVGTLTPGLARAGFLELAERSLQEALRSRPTPHPTLQCAPEDEPALRLVLQKHEGLFTLAVDPVLTPLEAELHWADGFDRIDVNAVATDILKAIGDLSPEVDRAPDATAASSGAHDLERIARERKVNG